MTVNLTLAKNADPVVVAALRPMREDRVMADHEFEHEADQLWAALKHLPTGTLDRVLRKWLHWEVTGAEQRAEWDGSDENLRRLNRLRLAYQSQNGNLRHDADAADHADTLTGLADGQDDEMGQVLKSAAEYLRRV